MTVTEYSIETHDHPHITRRQKLKLHAANGVAIKKSKGAWSKRPALKDLRGDAKVKRVKGGEAWSVPFTTPAEVAETPERAPVADVAEVEAVVEVANEAAEEENLSLDVTQHKAKYLFPDC